MADLLITRTAVLSEQLEKHPSTEASQDTQASWIAMGMAWPASSPEVAFVRKHASSYVEIL